LVPFEIDPNGSWAAVVFTHLVELEAATGTRLDRSLVAIGRRTQKSADLAGIFVCAATLSFRRPSLPLAMVLDVTFRDFCDDARSRRIGSYQRPDCCRRAVRAIRYAGQTCTGDEAKVGCKTGSCSKVGRDCLTELGIAKQEPDARCGALPSSTSTPFLRSPATG